MDLLVHRGWYENADFWPPKLYKRFILPYVKKLADYTHKHGVKFCYIMSMSIMPLLDFFKEAKIDVLYGVDPVQGGADLLRVKKEIGNRMCIWRGVNSAVTLKLWSKEEVRKAVTDAIKILAPGGGFILNFRDRENTASFVLWPEAVLSDVATENAGKIGIIIWKPTNFEALIWCSPKINYTSHLKLRTKTWMGSIRPNLVVVY